MPARTHVVCTVRGCGKLHEAKGYCNFHYIRWRIGKPFSDPKKLTASPHLPICKRCRGRIRGSAEVHKMACLRKRRVSSRAYRKANKAKWAAIQHDQRRGPLRERYLANKKLQWAVTQGHIVKPRHCSDCGKLVSRRRLHGHHEDYTQPLVVIWVCDPCHKARHRAKAA